MRSGVAREQRGGREEEEERRWRGEGRREGDKGEGKEREKRGEERGTETREEGGEGEAKSKWTNSPVRHLAYVSHPCPVLCVSVRVQAMVALNVRKKYYASLTGPFSESGIHEFLRSALCSQCSAHNPRQYTHLAPPLHQGLCLPAPHSALLLGSSTNPLNLRSGS